MLELACTIVVQLLSWWLTGGLIAIGFGVMVAGGAGASAVAEFCFSRPFLAVVTALGAIAGHVAGTLVHMSSGAGALLITRIVDPTLIVVGRMLRRLLFPRR